MVHNDTLLRDSFNRLISQLTPRDKSVPTIFVTGLPASGKSFFQDSLSYKGTDLDQFLIKKGTHYFINYDKLPNDYLYFGIPSDRKDFVLKKGIQYVVVIQAPFTQWKTRMDERLRLKDGYYMSQSTEKDYRKSCDDLLRELSLPDVDLIIFNT